MRVLFIFILITFATQSIGANWTCAPLKFADGSKGSGESFVLIEDGKNYKMPRGEHTQTLNFVGEELSSVEWQKMYLDQWGGIGVIWLRGEPGFKDGKVDYIAARANLSGFMKTTCNKF